MGEIFDLDSLRRRAGNDDALVHECIRTFHDGPDPLSDLHAAVADRAFDRARRAAHRQKGTLLALGARRAAGAASTVEQLAKNEDDSLPEAVRALAACIEEAKAAMSVVLRNADSRSPLPRAAG